MGQNAIRAAACGLVLMVAWAVLGGVIPGDAGRDTFAWWAQIWIPLGVGAATVFVSVAALVASSRATALARSIERQRDAAAAERAEEEQRHRLQAMAVEEARALMAWCKAASRHWNWEYSKIEKVGADRHGPSLRHRAEVMLGQSLVPGADALLELTTAEVDGLWTHMPDPTLMPDAKFSGNRPIAHSELLQRVTPLRSDRMIRRIRRWSLDPISSVAELNDERAALRSDPAAFFDYRIGLGVDGLKPISELPEPPANYQDRAAWLTDAGIVWPGASS